MALPDASTLLLIHNPRCSKSRAAKTLLEERGHPFTRACISRAALARRARGPAPPAPPPPVSSRAPASRPTPSPASARRARRRGARRNREAPRAARAADPRARRQGRRGRPRRRCSSWLNLSPSALAAPGIERERDPGNRLSISRRQAFDELVGVAAQHAVVCQARAIRVLLGRNLRPSAEPADRDIVCRRTAIAGLRPVEVEETVEAGEILDGQIQPLPPASSSPSDTADAEIGSKPGGSVKHPRSEFDSLPVGTGGRRNAAVWPVSCVE